VRCSVVLVATGAGSRKSLEWMKTYYDLCLCLLICQAIDTFNEAKQILCSTTILFFILMILGGSTILAYFRPCEVKECQLCSNYVCDVMAANFPEVILLFRAGLIVTFHVQTM